ncbi:MAG: hypothetical protein ACOC7T_05935 [Planctomycetota bacterium]
MRPRTFGKIVMAVLTAVCVLVALLFALEVDEEAIYKGYRAATYAVLSLTFATLIRYFED